MPSANIADMQSADWHDDCQSTELQRLGNWPACPARHNTDDAHQPSASPSWERTYHRESRPRSVHAARLLAKPTRAPWPGPARRTIAHWQRSATASDAVLKRL